MARRAKQAGQETMGSAGNLATFRAMINNMTVDGKGAAQGWRRGEQLADAYAYPGPEEEMRNKSTELFGGGPGKHPPYDAPYAGITKEFWNPMQCTWEFQVEPKLAINSLQVLLSHYTLSGKHPEWFWGGDHRGKEIVKSGWDGAYDHVLSAIPHKTSSVTGVSVTSKPLTPEEREWEQRMAIIDMRDKTVNKLFRLSYVDNLYVRICTKLFGSVQAILQAAGIAVKGVNLIHTANRSVLFTYHTDKLDGAKGFKPFLTAVVQLTGDTTTMHVVSAKQDAQFEGFGAVHVFPSTAFHRSGTGTTNTYKMTFLFGLGSASPAISLDDDEEEGSASAKKASKADEGSSSGVTKDKDDNPVPAVKTEDVKPEPTNADPMLLYADEVLVRQWWQ